MKARNDRRKGKKKTWEFDKKSREGVKPDPSTLAECYGLTEALPANQPEEQRQGIELPTRRVDTFPGTTYKQTNPRDSSQQEESRQLTRQPRAHW